MKFFIVVLFLLVTGAHAGTNSKTGAHPILECGLRLTHFSLVTSSAPTLTERLYAESKKGKKDVFLIGGLFRVDPYYYLLGVALYDERHTIFFNYLNSLKERGNLYNYTPVYTGEFKAHLTRDFPHFQLKVLNPTSSFYYENPGHYPDQQNDLSFLLDLLRKVENAKVLDEDPKPMEFNPKAPHLLDLYNQSEGEIQKRTPHDSFRHALLNKFNQVYASIQAVVESPEISKRERKRLLREEVFSDDFSILAFKTYLRFLQNDSPFLSRNCERAITAIKHYVETENLDYINEVYEALSILEKRPDLLPFNPRKPIEERMQFFLIRPAYLNEIEKGE